MTHGGLVLTSRMTDPDRSVAAASLPATGSVRSDTTKKPSMVGDGANDPKTTRPFRPGSASVTLAAARPTRWAGVTWTPVARRTCSM